MEILDLVQDFEADEEVLHKKLFIDEKNQLGLMFDYIDVSFRLHGFSEDTLIACFLDELDMLRSFLEKKGTLSSKHTGIIIGHLRHCLVQDTVAQDCLKESLKVSSAENQTTVDINVGVDAHMEIEETPGLSAHIIKLSPMDSFIDKI